MGDLNANYFIPTYTNPAAPLTAGATWVALPNTTTVSSFNTTGPVPVPGYHGRYSATVTTSLGATPLITGPGVLNAILFQTASTGIITIFDQNQQSNPGRLIGYFATNQVAGFYQSYNIPFQYGIMILQATAPTTITVIYSTP